MENKGNFLAAILLAGLILFGWQYAMGYFYPAAPEEIAGTKADDLEQSGVTESTGSAAQPEVIRPVGQALAESQRVLIDAPRVRGSINLTGARIDDLMLKDHRETLDKDSPPIRLLSPAGTSTQHFAQFGWKGEGVETPKSDTVWSANDTTLTPETPVTLSWANSTGQQFLITYSIDKDYMITAEQSFVNNGENNAAVQPLGLINRTNANADNDEWTIHSGPIGVFEDAANFDNDYDDVAEAGRKGVSFANNVGWAGFTDIYWLSALIPADKADNNGVKANFRAFGEEIFQSEIVYDKTIVGAGKTHTTTSKLFAGGKETNVLEAYENAGIPLFSRAIDWGWFRWFAQPMFHLLDWLFKYIGNFGLAIIAMVFIIRGLMFPIAQKQFKSMAQMRAIQPKMKKIQERYKDDKQKQQQEIMALYKKEKANPLAGCLPIFLQIPIFFALYKVLRLAIEMRHEPFIGWIKDLSAPDPLTPINLFGLIPFDPPALLAIGILPIIVGITMWLQFKLNPAPIDPVQQQVFSIMPWILMFVMAPFAAGLQLYWAVSNLLTIAQQKWLYSRHPQLKEQMAKEAEEKAREKQRKAAEAEAKG
ncbi:membrane protein insertase YidC [Sphingorhabdus sp. Alg239-R122]|uniref:membrane protein insertase YidC n=1 Tax=Sphingorhabdus sp. Alg239-R122 TaxID=2305989 RepID=UPI0013DCBC7F|nr:membrane protein insertase YidC [Sphingorhabdus sp. Alg239-R122]